jgi:hypothetical protein
MDSNNVSLKVFRNREWVQAFTVQKDGVNQDIHLDSLALVVLDGTGAMVLSNKVATFSNSNATATFVYGDTAMGGLVANARYSWQFLRKPNQATNSDLLVSGPLVVSESPVFPP